MTKAKTPPPVTDARPFQPDRTPPAQDHDSPIDLILGVNWQGRDCRYADQRILPGYTPARTPWPEALAPLMRQGRQNIRPGELIPLPDPALRPWLPRRLFRYGETPPAIGRFLAAGALPATAIPDSAGPLFRVIDEDERRLRVDFNHPLAGRSLQLTLRRQPASGTTFTSAQSGAPLRLLCDNGPGMQEELPRRETCFDPPQACSRIDESDDRRFFTPSLQPFWDRRALNRVSQLYRQLIPPGQRVLDLMAGVHSPLQESGIDDLRLSCAGLHAIELEHNPLCRERRSLNVNRDRPLPWPANHFDAVLIHAAIEYVVQPVRLLQDIHRLLRPGGRLIISFSNHWVEEKAIRIWRELMDFERVGLLLFWLRRTGGFQRYRACSLRGMPRDPDSAARSALPCSDPVFAVWAEKAAP